MWKHARKESNRVCSLQSLSINLKNMMATPDRSSLLVATARRTEVFKAPTAHAG
jgi:hypothetical protein